MKTLLLQFATYNVETNKAFGDALALQPESILNADMENSFSSIFKTFLHLWDAEAIWWQRLHAQANIIRPSVTGSGDITACSSALQAQSTLWVDWISNASDAELVQVLSFVHVSGEVVRQQVNQVILHLFSHQGYHRGQIITMLRQQGIIQNLPGAGFIDFVRKNA